MKFKKLVYLFILLIPINIFAYSNKVYVGGESLGIHINTKNVLVVGFYKVNNKYLNSDKLEIGDYIIKVNDNIVNNINDITKYIDKYKDDKYLNITYKRNNKEYNTKIELYKDYNDVYKTGIYVKDTINGIGTLTYIDPEDNTFGALGHEISLSNVNGIKIDGGNIFRSIVTNIKKSTNDNPGSKDAKLDKENVYGSIIKNTNKGIFGKIDNIKSSDLIEVSDDIKLGKAYIRTVIDNEKVEEFSINILDFDLNSDTKNILFEITDKRLLSKTGGIVSGMSGSPIIQDNKLVGAVTHVIVNDVNNGYGILIKNMLLEQAK